MTAAAPGIRQSTLTGTVALLRLAVRRDRVQLTAWLGGLTGFTAATAAAFRHTFPTQAQLTADITLAATNPAIRVLGLASGATTGAYTMVRDYLLLAVLAAMMSILAVVRHTRQGEETGRAELLDATVVGRHASLVAALIVTVAADTALALLLAGAMMAVGLPVAGSCAAGVAVAAVGAAFAGIAAVTAQLAATTRAASGLAAAILGVACLLSGVGNLAGTADADRVRVTSAWPAWLSPVGWGQQIRPFDRNLWQLVGLFALLLAACVAVARHLADRRDHGLGLLPPRRGRSAASWALRSPLGLVLRLQRGTLTAWAVGLLGFALVWGALAKQVADPTSTAGDWYAQVSGTDQLLDAYHATIMTMAGMAVAGYLVQVLLRMRSEEAAGLLDPVLATAVSRSRWLAVHLVTACLGTAGLLLLFATGMALTTGAALGNTTGHLRNLTLAALAQLPGPLALGASVVTVIGLAPRAATGLSWTMLLTAVLTGPIFDLGLPRWARDCSPFTHVPMAPAASITPAPLLTLLAVGVTLALVGLGALRRRDLALPA